MRHNYQKLMTLIPDLRGWPNLHMKVSRGKPPCLSSCQAMKIDHSLSTQVRFAWEMPISTPHVEPRRSVFVWEMPIYKPHVESQRSVLRGKFLFTNLRSSHGGAFCVGNPYLQTQFAAWRGRFVWEIFYLQTQLERFVWEISYLQTQLVCFPY